MPRPSALALPLALLALTLVAAPDSPAAQPSGKAPDWSRAVSLAQRAMAQLENEQPAKAEELYEQLTQVVPGDPMPWANLAVSQLRQQNTDAALQTVAHALELAPKNGEVLAVKGAILDWTGQSAQALAAYGKAAELAPDDPQVLYSLLREATSAGDQKAADQALDRLAQVRPDNFVVLVERGKAAIQRGDREAASGVFLRIRDLLWQAPPVAGTALKGVLDALESGDVANARIPAARLENVLKITSMYRESLRELSSGIQGVPLHSFATQPPTTSFGDPIAVRFSGERLSEAPNRGTALALGDFDGDGSTDVARLLNPEKGPESGPESGDVKGGLEIRPSAGTKGVRVLPAPAATGLLATDLWNDGGLDLVAFGPEGTTVWNGTAGKDGKVELAASDGAKTGLAGAGGRAAAVLDYDIEGDLDLALAGGPVSPVSLYRNPLDAPLEDVTSKVFPELHFPGARALVASDLDRDGDVDLLAGGDSGLLWLDNLRQGKFVDRTAAGGLAGAGPVAALVSADLNDDGLPDVVAVGRGVTLWRNAGGHFEHWNAPGLPKSGPWTGVVAFDADNDGRLDLGLAGPGGVAVLGQTAEGGFRALEVSGGPSRAAALDAFDADGDGDLDLVVAGPEGLHLLTNQGGNRNHWLAVRLKGLTQGNGKNNVRGVGATVEVKAGTAYQFREHDGRVSHFGLGRLEAADVLRVVWNNGVPQDRLDVAGNQALTEEQVLKGSCPFLYTFKGQRIGFVTDLLWNAPAGLPAAPGKWVPADPEELVRVDGAAALPGRPGVYDLRITEELWEAAYFDLTRLWVVDHPADVSVASNLEVVPGGGPRPERVLGTRDVRPVVAAWDGRGRDVTARVRSRDSVYADGYTPSAYQGLAERPWSLTFDLGEAPAAPVRLLLDGWIFPTDASINIALAQRRDVALEPPKLEVETAAGWRVLMPDMGHPAGKTKTMVVDTPPLPPGAHRLRITTSMWISWDRIAWSTAPDDSAPRVVARLAPERADLHYRGFSALVRRAPNGPHEFAYQRVSTRSPWGEVRGRYTRYGDVRELLAASDSRSVVMAPGDEIALLFDTSKLPPPPAGWQRTLFLESHGWDKDFDKHTYAIEGGSLPLPFEGMGTYPWGDDVRPPSGPAWERYQREWLTRRASSGANGPSAP
jgi:Flp pilus assembly protein TadD